MLVNQWHATILDPLRQHGAVSHDDLRDLLGFSSCTIRRDLNLSGRSG